MEVGRFWKREVGGNGVFFKGRLVEKSTTCLENLFMTKNMKHQETSTESNKNVKMKQGCDVFFAFWS